MRRSVLSLIALVFAAVSTIDAQPVLLQIRPHVGDTIALSVEQRVELTGGKGEATRRMTTVTQVFSRVIVNRATSRGADITAITDSIRTATFTSGRAPALKRAVVKDPTMKLHVSTYGEAELIEGGRAAHVAASFGPMPATLSEKAVAPGDKWERELKIPIAGEAGAVGRVRATFRLDSLSDNGDIAYISMRGKLTHDHKDGSTSELDGNMTGSMQLNRRLGWITDTRAVIDVTSTVNGRDGQPMRIRTRVTQQLRAAPQQ
jgi:hypothetical protein